MQNYFSIVTTRYSYFVTLHVWIWFRFCTRMMLKRLEINNKAVTRRLLIDRSTIILSRTANVQLVDNEAEFNDGATLYASVGVVGRACPMCWLKSGLRMRNTTGARWRHRPMYDMLGAASSWWDKKSSLFVFGMFNSQPYSLVFLPERDYVTFGSLVSQFRLSSVTLVHPTQEVEAFGSISSPLCTLAILWPSCKILRISSQGNPSAGSVKRKRGSKMSLQFAGYC